MQQQDVAANKSRGMDATSFVVAGIEITLAEHLENIRFVIWSKYINFFVV